MRGRRRIMGREEGRSLWALSLLLGVISTAGFMLMAREIQAGNVARGRWIFFGIFIAECLVHGLWNMIAEARGSAVELEGLTTDDVGAGETETPVVEDTRLQVLDRRTLARHLLALLHPDTWRRFSPIAPWSLAAPHVEPLSIAMTRSVFQCSSIAYAALFMAILFAAATWSASGLHWIAVFFVVAGAYAIAFAAEAAPEEYPHSFSAMLIAIGIGAGVQSRAGTLEMSMLLFGFVYGAILNTLLSIRTADETVRFRISWLAFVTAASFFLVGGVLTLGSRARVILICTAISALFAAVILVAELAGASAQRRSTIISAAFALGGLAMMLILPAILRWLHPRELTVFAAAVWAVFAGLFWSRIGKRYGEIDSARRPPFATIGAGVLARVLIVASVLTLVGMFCTLIWERFFSLLGRENVASIPGGPAVALFFFFLPWVLVTRVYFVPFAAAVHVVEYVRLRMARADPQEAWLASASRRIEALPLPLPFGAAWLARIAAVHGAAPALAEAERQMALSWESLTVEQFVVRLFRARVAPCELLRWGVRRRLLPLFVRAAGREAFLRDCMRLLWILGVLEEEPLPRRARITIRSKGVTFAIEGRTSDDRRELLARLRDAAPGESLARLIAIVDGVLFAPSIGVAQACTARTIELLREADCDAGPLQSVQAILGACSPELPLTAIPRHDRETLKRIALSVESRRQAAEPSLEGFVGAFLVRTLATRTS